MRSDRHREGYFQEWRQRRVQSGKCVSCLGHRDRKSLECSMCSAKHNPRVEENRSIDRYVFISGKVRWKKRRRILMAMLIQNSYSWSELRDSGVEKDAKPLIDSGLAEVVHGAYKATNSAKREMQVCECGSAISKPVFNYHKAKCRGQSSTLTKSKL